MWDLADGRREPAPRSSVKLLPGVDDSDVDPVLWAYLGAIATRHRLDVGPMLIVTSLRRAPGPRKSLHSPPPGELCRAADLRRWSLDTAKKAEEFAIWLQKRYGDSLGVLLEPEWLTAEQLAERGGRAAVAPHLHVQLKPGATLLQL